MEVVDVLDDLRGQHPRLDAVALLELERLEDGDARLAHLALRGAVDLEHAVEPLDDLHARPHVGGLDGDVGHPVDLDARGDLHDQGRLAGDGEEALGHRPEEGGELGLERVEEDEAAKVGHGGLGC